MVEIPDVSDLTSSNVPEKINWTQIRGAFILLTPEEFGKGSPAQIAKILGVPRTSFNRHAKMVDPATKKNWWQERESIQSDIYGEVRDVVVRTQSEQRAKLITDSVERKKLIDEKVDEFLESDEFQVNDENLLKLIEISQKISMDLAKLSGVVDSGGSKAYTFNINVPLKYLTAEGRAWARDQLSNPSPKALDVDYTVVEDEEQMQSKRLGEVKDEEEKDTNSS